MGPALSGSLLRDRMLGRGRVCSQGLRSELGRLKATQRPSQLLPSLDTAAGRNQNRPGATPWPSQQF